MGIDTELYVEEFFDEKWLFRGTNFIKRSTVSKLEKIFTKLTFSEFNELSPSKESFDDGNICYPWDIYYYKISDDVRIFMISNG